MKIYKTSQRKCLLSFFEEHPAQHFSVDEIAKSVDNISMSAIYHNVNYFVREGIIQRFQEEGSQKSLYQFVGSPSCKSHLHLKCEICGNIQHIDPQTNDLLVSMIKNSNAFDIDKSKTILFGRCSKCE